MATACLTVGGALRRAMAPTALAYDLTAVGASGGKGGLVADFIAARMSSTASLSSATWGIVAPLLVNRGRRPFTFALAFVLAADVVDGGALVARYARVAAVSGFVCL